MRSEQASRRRFLKRVAMAGGVVIARSIVRDLHSHEQAARLLARMMVVFSFVPILAPISGDLLTQTGGWRAITQSGRGANGRDAAPVAGAGARIDGKRMKDMIVKTTIWTPTMDA